VNREEQRHHRALAIIAHFDTFSPRWVTFYLREHPPSASGSIYLERVGAAKLYVNHLWSKRVKHMKDKRRRAEAIRLLHEILYLYKRREKGMLLEGPLS
jgi:hypothetical protein